MQIKNVLTTDCDGVILNNEFIPLRRTNMSDIDICAPIVDLVQWFACEVVLEQKYCNAVQAYRTTYAIIPK